MRTRSWSRPFPFTCHAVLKPASPRRTFFVGLGAIALSVACVAAASSQPEDEPLQRLVYLCIAGLWLCVFPAMPFRMGFRAVVPNRVVIARGATWVLPRLIPLELLVGITAGLLMVASGIFYITAIGGLHMVWEFGLHAVAYGPVVIALGAALIMVLAWQQLRGMRLSPEGITYWRGFGRISLGWDELGDVITTNDVRDHEQHRRYAEKYLPGAKIVVPVESVMGVLLRVHWEDVNTPRLLLEAEYFRVEANALLTAILALRDHPELRPLLGTRASKALFVGPPWRVRRHLYRTQQWWPAGTAPEDIAVDSDGVVKEFQ